MPETTAQRERQQRGTPLCKLIPLRDALDGVLVRPDGSYVAGYKVRGALTYFASENDRNELKARVDALYRTCPEESMRIQIRYEVNDQIGSQLDEYVEARRTDHPAAIALDDERVAQLRQRAQQGEFLTRTLSIYFCWSAEKHQQLMRASGIPWNGASGKKSLSLSGKTCITCEKAAHDAMLGQFNSLLRGIESSMAAADFAPVRMATVVTIRPSQLCSTRPRSRSAEILQKLPGGGRVPAKYGYTRLAFLS